MSRLISFYGSASNHSGYGKAVLNFIEAFELTGFNVNFKVNGKYTLKQTPYNGNTNIDFYLHCPPYTKYNNQSYKIGYFYWEADKLPSSWVIPLKTLDEVWVPCNLVKMACVNAGIKMSKIKVIPTPVKRFDLSSKISIPSYFSKDKFLNNNVYKFYSIFQWHERKGYKELLKAYFSEFSFDDNVILILKVNPLKIGTYTEENIVKDIIKIKTYVGKKNSPNVYLSKKIIDQSDINALHNTADCYVAAHHGEGWGMPIHDAMYAGNQIITTQFGGVSEYLSNSSAHIIKHDLINVSGMEWSNLYNMNQKWALPNVSNLSSIMRDVFVNHNKYEYKGKNARNIAESMSIEVVSEIIKEELLKI